MASPVNKQQWFHASVGADLQEQILSQQREANRLRQSAAETETSLQERINVLQAKLSAADRKTEDGVTVTKLKVYVYQYTAPAGILNNNSHHLLFLMPVRDRGFQARLSAEP